MPKKTCFVIMPFGEKPDVDGKKLDFDRVYKTLIKPSVEAVNLDVIRSDEIGKPGWIHANMIKQIYHADVAVVDITTLNANVFYELGVRQALCRSVTVLIRRKGTAIPFNILGLNVIEYDPEKGIEEAKRKIGEFIHSGLKSRESDSLVHNVLELKIDAQSKPLSRTEVFRYRLVSAPKKEVRLITGNIENIRDIDIWVNSENTNMQMARCYDRSVSSMIRYLGAERDPAGFVVNDSISAALAQAVGARNRVDPAMIFPTTAGSLRRTHGVKWIFHAAAVEGAIGRGYLPIPDVHQCVKNALVKADSIRSKNGDLKSILFPLFGTGTARAEARLIVESLFEEAIAHLSANRNGSIQHVYFSAWTERDLAACQSVLDHSPAVVRVEPSPRRQAVPVASGSPYPTRDSSLQKLRSVQRRAR